MTTTNDNTRLDGVRSIDCSEFPSFMWSDFAGTGWQIGRTVEETINCHHTISRGVGKCPVYIPNDPAVSSTGMLAILESRHETMLEWREPWPACGPEGNDLDAHITLRATVHDCINLQRRVAKAAERPTMGDDENHLLDFMAIHWARVVEVEFNELTEKNERLTAWISEIFRKLGLPDGDMGALEKYIQSNDQGHQSQPGAGPQPEIKP